MEKLSCVPNCPEIQIITSVLLLQGEAKIYFQDIENNKYEVHFPVVYDFRQCVEVAFIARKFQFISHNKSRNSFFTVDDSEWINSFIKSSDGVYGDDVSDYFHFIMFDSIDTRIEVISTCFPAISKIE